MKHTGESGRRRSAGRRVLNILLVFLLIFLILVLIGMGYTLAMLGKMNYVGEQEATLSPAELENYMEQSKDEEIPEGEDAVLDFVPGEKIENQNMIHILLIGEDARPGENRGRSDAMLLCSIDTAAKKLTVTSFLRDLYVTIPGFTDHKLNSAYAWGGMKLLSETILLNFGIEIDACFAVDFRAFETVIDSLGGVDIFLTDGEAAYLSCPQGMTRLDGSKALMYARIRSIGQGDFGRTDRQRKLLQVMIERCKTMGTGQLHALLDELLPLVQTNAEQQRILQYCLELTPILTGGCETQKLCIPAEGTYEYAWAKGMSILLPNLEENRKILQSVLRDNR